LHNFFFPLFEFVKKRGYIFATLLLIMRSILFLFLVFFAMAVNAQALNAVINVQNTNCAVNGGSAQAVVTGGTQPYSYVWSNTATSNPTVGLTFGNYSVTIFSAGKTDSITRTFTVADAATVLITTTPNDTICAGKTVVLQANAQPAGGTFEWSGGDLPTNRNGDTIHVAPLTDQTYSVVYNHPSCSGTKTIRIEAGVVKASLGGITQPTCGLSNGSIIGAGTGYKGTFSWLQDGQPLSSNASILSSLKSGTYTFILTDEIAGCSDTVQNIVLQDVTSFSSVNAITTTSDDCLKATGTASITVTGGSGNYTYKWSHNAALNSNTASNLAKGTYRVTVNDGVCTPFDTAITISGPVSTTTVAATATNDNCSSNTGTATATATDGTPPYTYIWSTGANTQNITQLAGNASYTVTATDGAGCTAETTVQVGDIPAPAISFLAFDSLCPAAQNGVLSVSASGGLAPYSFAWSHNNSVTANIADNLAAGTYSATVTDAGGCTASAQITIASYDNPQVTLDDSITIFRGEVAALKVQTSLPVTAVKWNPYIQSSDNSLTAFPKPDNTTMYFVDVEYGKGCSIADSILVTVVAEEGEVIIPNIFTPNGDGVNDFFYINSKAISRLDVRIFDRWGNKVFESNNIDFKWDGVNEFTKIPSPNGVFTYSIEYTTFAASGAKLAKGSVTLVR
jgi:gliding motility-associated-like protein